MKLYVTKRRTDHNVIVLSDAKLESSAEWPVWMSDKDFAEYQQAKDRYEHWQRKLAHIARYGW